MIRHIDALRKMTPRKGLQFRVLSHAEAAQVRAQQYPKVVPIHPRTPPSEYTRVLLAAKEGSMAPGEADRRIARMGGKVRVQPLPRPPA